VTLMPATGSSASPAVTVTVLCGFEKVIGTEFASHGWRYR
jgi:hypothetical protein